MPCCVHSYCGSNDCIIDCFSHFSWMMRSLCGKWWSIRMSSSTWLGGNGKQGQTAGHGLHVSLLSCKMLHAGGVLLKHIFCGSLFLTYVAKCECVIISVNLFTHPWPEFWFCGLIGQFDCVHCQTLPSVVTVNELYPCIPFSVTFGLYFSIKQLKWKALIFGPHGLTFTWWGCCGLCFWCKPTELAQSFLFCSCVFVSVFMALSTVFHSINSPDNSLLSHSVLPVLFLPYWSFQLYISLWKSPSALI